MGTRLAPALATIYIGDLVEDYLHTSQKKTYIVGEIYRWCLYNLVPLFRGFRRIFRQIESNTPWNSFYSKISSQACDFLDFTIYKVPDFASTGKLSTKIYCKPSNTFSFPLGFSYMPRNIHKGIAIGELTSLIRNTTSLVLFEHYKKKLSNHFWHRKYAKGIIEILKKMNHTTRQSLLSTKKIRNIERPLPFITKFNIYRPSPQRILMERNIWRQTFIPPLSQKSIYSIRKSQST